MAISKSKKVKTKKSTVVKAKTKAPKAGKKRTLKRAQKDNASETQSMDLSRVGANPEALQDPAHSPGHKKMGSKNQAFGAFRSKTQEQNKAAMNRLTESAKIHTNVISRRSTNRG